MSELQAIPQETNKMKRASLIPKHIQLRCPKCGEEFSFPYGKIEEERASLSLRLQEAQLRLREIKKLPKSAYNDNTWRERTKWSRQIEESQMRLTEIKTLLKQVNVSVTHDLFQLYRERMRDIYGDKVDEDVMTLAKQNLEAYKISKLSAHEFYTHKGGKVAMKV